jgi:two-component system, OmpR family, phosphate regulon sensor histidine kinase PhoR
MESNFEAGAGKKSGRLTSFFVLFGAFLAIIAAAAIGIGYNVHRYWEDVLRVEITRNLTQKAQMFAARVNTDHEHKIEDIVAQEGQSAGARATVVDTNGRVVADSEVQLSALENEGRRAEFVAALRGETSVVTRKRNDFGVPVLYAAVPVSGGAVRLAYPLADIDIATAHARRVLLLGSAIAALAALAISWLAATTVTRRT